jgi:hypothetical protein
MYFKEVGIEKLYNGGRNSYKYITSCERDNRGKPAGLTDFNLVKMNTPELYPNYIE